MKWDDELIAILEGLIGGARYGVKIRLPHALLMTTLFGKGLTAKQKFRRILQLTWEHASSLAAFAAIYKTILFLFRLVPTLLLNQTPASRSSKGSLLRPIGRILFSMIAGGSASSLMPAVSPGYPATGRHALIAGAVGGYIVWGHYSPVNYQILLYLTSRILVGLGQRFAAQTGMKVNPRALFRLGSAFFWGIVMFLFEDQPDVLHRSLERSMNEIYRYSTG